MYVTECGGSSTSVNIAELLRRGPSDEDDK
jgi:hypothetical protein